MNSNAQTSAPTNERGQRGVARVLAKLENSLESGNYYEAHQMYRTLYFRYTAQKKFDDCLELLYTGALNLAEKEQDTSAADLGLLLVDTLEKRGNHHDNEMWLERLGKIILKIRSCAVERETLIARAIKWSCLQSEHSLGAPRMHKLIAQAYWADGNYEQGRYHLLICGDGSVCGSKLIEVQQSKGYASEVDLFIVQAVLQQLVYRHPKMAEETFEYYTRNHPQVRRKGKGFELPLLNFINFLLQSMKLNRPDFFRQLCALYKPSLQRDFSYENYLSKIGVIYFNEQPPPKKEIGGGGLMGGMFGDLFSKLMHDSDDDDDEQQLEYEQTTTNANATRNNSHIAASDLD